MPRPSSMTYARAAVLLRLDVGASAPPLTMDVVKKARKARMFEVHPDRGGSADAVQEVQDAYKFFQEHGISEPSPSRASSGRYDSFGMGSDFADELGRALRYAAERARREREAQRAQRARHDAEAARSKSGPWGAHTGPWGRSEAEAEEDASRYAAGYRWDPVQDARPRPGHAGAQGFGEWDREFRPGRGREDDGRRGRPPEPPPDAPAFLRNGKHKLRFVSVTRYESGFGGQGQWVGSRPRVITRYHFTVVSSDAGHKFGDRVVWNGRGFHPTREWAPGEVVLADTSGEQPSFVTEEQAKAQEKARETLFGGRDGAPRTGRARKRRAEPERVYDRATGTWVPFEPPDPFDDDLPF